MPGALHVCARRVGLHLLLAGVLLSGTRDAAHAQLRLRPTALRTDGDVLPALRISFDHRAGGLDVRGSFPREWTWAAQADAPIVWDAERNPESLRAALSGGLQISLYRPPPAPGPGGPTIDDPGAAWNYGYVALELLAAAESPQDMDFADVVLGGALTYEHDQYTRLWFLPEVRLAVGAAFCAGCDELSDADDTDHLRLDAEAGWNIPLDRTWAPAILRPVWLRLRGRVFQPWGVSEDLTAGDDATLRSEGGRSGSAELAYRVDDVQWLHEVFVRWHGGELPVQPHERHAWRIGISLFL